MKRKPTFENWWYDDQSLLRDRFGRYAVVVHIHPTHSGKERNNKGVFAFGYANITKDGIKNERIWVPPFHDKMTYDQSMENIYNVKEKSFSDCIRKLESACNSHCVPVSTKPWMAKACISNMSQEECSIVKKLWLNINEFYPETYFRKYTTHGIMESLYGYYHLRNNDFKNDFISEIKDIAAITRNIVFDPEKSREFDSTNKRQENR